MRYYIADCHFGHDRVRLLEKRPFATVAQMDAYMISQWNQAVRRKKDEVIILGDFCLNKGEQVNRLLHCLNGKKYLVSGNHDGTFLRDKRFDTSLFEWIRPYAELHDNNRKVILSHYPMLCYNGQYGKRPAYMLYGHVHNTMDYRNVKRFVRETRETAWKGGEGISCNLINCYAGFSDYKPLSLDEWLEREQCNLLG